MGGINKFKSIFHNKIFILIFIIFLIFLFFKIYLYSNDKSTYSEGQPTLKPLFHVYSADNEKHFYTGKLEEVGFLFYADFDHEKIGCFFDKEKFGTVPLYRYFKNNLTLFLTISNTEKENALKSDATDDSIIGYVYPKEKVDTIPLFKLSRNDKDMHIYTASSEQKDKLVLEGYQSSVIAYIYPSEYQDCNFNIT